MNPATIALILLTSLPLIAQDQSIPDAPVPQPTQKATVHTPDAFFSFRSDWRKPPLHPNKRSWAIFLGAHAALYTGFAYDLRHTHQAREEMHSELPVMFALSGFDFVAFKFFSPAMSVELPAYALVHYSLDAAKGP
jgi:hypothetical protein